MEKTIMANLFDSCSLIVISDTERLLNIAKCCKNDLKNKMGITSVILRELRGHAQTDNTPTEDYYALQNYIELYIQSKDIDFLNIESNPEYYKSYIDIRKKFYGWMINKKYFEQLKSKGKIDPSLNFNDMREQYQKVDVGECSLLSIAVLNPTNSIIVSEDSGRSHYLPSQNIFDIFKRKGIEILTYEKWLEKHQLSKL